MTAPDRARLDAYRDLARETHLLAKAAQRAHVAALCGKADALAAAVAAARVRLGMTATAAGTAGVVEVKAMDEDDGLMVEAIRLRRLRWEELPFEFDKITFGVKPASDFEALDKQYHTVQNMMTSDIDYLLALVKRLAAVQDAMAVVVEEES